MASSELLPLVRSKIVLGEPLPWNVLDRQGSLLLCQGQVVDTERQLELLLERGATVHADEARAIARQVLVNTTKSPARSAPTSLFDLWNKLPLRLKEVWGTLPQSAMFIEELEKLTEDLIGLAQREPDIGLYLIVRQEQSHLVEYGYNHSVHTALVCVLMARRLEWTDAETKSLVKAALTMNMGIAELQGRMASQDFPVLNRQEAQLRRHPHEAAIALTAAGVTDEICLQAVRDHHEHVDGSGYPTGKSEVDQFATALRLADVFTAKLTPRTIRQPLSPQEAERQMLSEGKANAQVMGLVMAVIQEFGIYPPGDLVALKSGEIGVVVKRSANAKAPIVAAITDANGQPVTTTTRRDTADPVYAIVAAAVNKRLVARLPPERLFGYALV